MLGDEMISRIVYVYIKSLIYRDSKLDNFL